LNGSCFWVNLYASGFFAMMVAAMNFGTCLVSSRYREALVPELRAF
jgi:hypothetical protein